MSAEVRSNLCDVCGGCLGRRGLSFSVSGEHLKGEKWRGVTRGGCRKKCCILCGIKREFYAQKLYGIAVKEQQLFES